MEDKLMGYPKDLDEYTETELVNELIRRLALQDHELCDYCGRASTTTPCKFLDRHIHKPPISRRYRTGRRTSDKLKDRLLALRTWFKL